MWGETPAVDEDRAEWTHGSHEIHDAAVLAANRCCRGHVITLVTQYLVFSETRVVVGTGYKHLSCFERGGVEAHRPLSKGSFCGNDWSRS